jgi:hypothetical protein
LNSNRPSAAYGALACATLCVAVFATPTAGRAASGKGPSPTPTPSAAATASAVPSAAASEAPATPIPTQPPTPRPLAPNQPTVPQSMHDPNVIAITARPIRELSQIGWMQGVWNVTGIVNTLEGTTIPIKPTTYVFSPIMKGRWMFGADGGAKDYIYLTFDPFARHWVALRFGENPAYGMWESQRGWVGNRIDFVTNFSFVNGRQYRRRLTIIHKDARTFGLYELEETSDGSYIPDDAYEFTKQ